MRAELADSEAARAALVDLEADLAVAREDREQLLGALGAVDTLAQRIARVSQHAKSGRGAPQLKEEERPTLKPVAEPAESPRRERGSMAPEITVDGVLLAP